MLKYKVGMVVFGILFCIFGIILIVNLIIKNENQAMIIVFSSFTPIFFLCMIIELIQYAITSSPKAAGKYAEAQVSGKLVDGLPIPASVIVLTKLFNEKIELEAFTGNKPSDHQRFDLGMEKVQKITLLNEKEIQQIVTQSAPGMIIGAAAFGILGAMVGGRVKTKNKVKINRLMLIDYISDGENKQILINVSESISQADIFANKFRKMKPQSNQPVQL